MKTHTFIPIAWACLLSVGCEQKPPAGAQTTPSPTPAPSPPPSLTATPESAPNPPAPLKSPEESAPSPTLTPSPPPSPGVAPESTPTLLKSPEESTPSTTPSPQAASSNGRPTFSSQSANEYVQSYDAYIDDFKLAYQAMKQGDMTKYQAVIQRAHELESKGEKLGGELSPEEQARFADYLNKKADELAQFASQNR